MSNFASGYIKYVNHLEQINDAAINCPEKMIEEVESSYREHLENIARNIANHKEKIKVCMLSGPSSSGKTTTAGFFKEQLSRDLRASMDNRSHLGRIKLHELQRNLFLHCRPAPGDCCSGQASSSDV